MTYNQFKNIWLDQQGNPATGYDHDQESVIVQAYIEHLEGKVKELESKIAKVRHIMDYDLWLDDTVYGKLDEATK